MGQALYRKYRSRSFSEVVGQEPITQTLQKAIRSGRISHAYLFSGPRGVGKTSVARILAHAVNNLAYKDESVHLDIIEIDAASNRRIDEIRDLRERVHIAPTSAKYKVYIIDEVHMLTREAFNALLKTLEEPPDHCIFILATTEVHKLPETIISRTQRFNFKPTEKSQAIAHLKNIAQKEAIEIESAVLELLAEHADGSLRDSIGMLDQLGGKSRIITEQSARELLGLPAVNIIQQLFKSVSQGDPRVIVSLLDNLRQQGTNAVEVASQLSKNLRKMIIDSSQSANWMADLLRKLLDISAAKQPYEVLEIALIETAIGNSQSKAKPLNEKFGDEVSTDEAKGPARSGFNLDLWPQVVAVIKGRAAALYTALRLAEPEVDGNVLKLTFQFPLHKNKVSGSHNIKLIGEVIEELSGAKVEIKCTLGVLPKEPAQLTTISNIFGKAELVES
ncbi:DNA polymerase III subunit gamma/tau [Candidatus Saccharibacteria bacterium]|nr:DNA polymerase III subunit gamma/tau [Candidatus Saccharibacteria bacterium]